MFAPAIRALEPGRVLSVQDGVCRIAVAVHGSPLAADSSVALVLPQSRLSEAPIRSSPFPRSTTLVHGLLSTQP